MLLTLNLDARLEPKERFYLEDALQENDAGEVTGGGSVLKEDMEIVRCAVDIVFDQDEKSLEWLTALINSMGIPKGSLIEGVDPPVEVGTLEGLAVYLNGVDLPEEVYKKCDVNYVIERLSEAVKPIGAMYSSRRLSEYTALYFYGTSCSAMREKMEEFISTYPLCQKCRIEQIA